MLFFCLLPFLNALADWLSLWATRSFLGSISENRHGLLSVLVFLTADLILAALCLVVLLGSLAFILELWAHFFQDTLAFDWRTYRDGILAGDWPSGTALYLMVATTLIPTVIHLIAGLAALLTCKSRIHARVGRRLRELRDDPAQPMLSKEELSQRLGELLVASFLGLFCATLIALAGAAVLWEVGSRVLDWVK